MLKSKIAITIDDKIVGRIDSLVRQKEIYESQSGDQRGSERKTEPFGKIKIGARSFKTGSGLRTIDCRGRTFTGQCRMAGILRGDVRRADLNPVRGSE